MAGPGRLRITGGAWRGRRLRAAAGTRPTQERVREALFSRWQSRLAEATVLELYCGGGVVGLEAASRGARRVTFVDHSERALRTLRGNCAELGLERPEVLRCRLPDGLTRLEGNAYDLIFADPPYTFTAHRDLLEGTAPLLSDDGELVIEHPARAVLPGAAGGLERRETREYGDTALSFYRRCRF